jgi:hypothetical protein
MSPASSLDSVREWRAEREHKQREREGYTGTIIEDQRERDRAKEYGGRYKRCDNDIVESGRSVFDFSYGFGKE